MLGVAVEKGPAGFRVDGRGLLRGNCGCGGFSRSGGAGVADCSQTSPIVKKVGNVITFLAKPSPRMVEQQIEESLARKASNII